MKDRRPFKHGGGIIAVLIMRNQVLLDKIAKEEGFKVDKLLHHWDEPRFVAAKVVGAGGRQMVFKLLVSENWWDEESFYREIEFLRFVTETGLSRWVPKLQKTSLETEPYWYLREFVNHKITGDIITDFGFRQAFMEEVAPDVLVETLTQIWLLPSSTQHPLVNRRAKDEGHLAGSVVIVGAVKHPKSRKWEKELSSFMSVSEKRLNEEPLVFSHTDLYPENILFGEKQVSIIDWEHYGRWFVFADAVFIYLLAWQNPDWQQEWAVKIRQEFATWAKNAELGYSEEVLELSWQTMVYYWAVRLLNHSALMREQYGKSRNQKLKEKAQDLINYLIAAVFDKIGDAI